MRLARVAVAAGSRGAARGRPRRRGAASPSVAIGRPYPVRPAARSGPTSGTVHTAEFRWTFDWNGGLRTVGRMRSRPLRTRLARRRRRPAPAHRRRLRRRRRRRPPAPTTAGTDERPASSRRARSCSATPPGRAGSRWPSPRRPGIFEENGLDVELKYFADYIGVARRDGRRQARRQHPDAQRHDVRRSPPATKQAIVVVNDNSTGNDAIICDESITSIEDLKGKTIAAEQGVVDHFLLLQGLATEGMTEDDIDFRGVLTDAAAARLRRRRVRLRRRVRPVHARGARAARARTWCSARRTSPAPSRTTSW